MDVMNATALNGGIGASSTHKHMKEETVLKIAKKQGGFWVSWRYRDAHIRWLCNQMVRKGLLRKGKYEAGRDEFLLANTK